MIEILVALIVVILLVIILKKVSPDRSAKHEASPPMDLTQLGPSIPKPKRHPKHRIDPHPGYDLKHPRNQKPKFHF
jgi:hypothetical protein